MLFQRDSYSVRSCILIAIIINHAWFSNGEILDRTKIEDQFHSYVKQYNKKYESAIEYERRLSIFSDSVLEVEEHNSKNLSWTKKINEFSDMTVEEFKKRFGGGYVQSPFSPSKSKLTMPSLSELPIHKDWREDDVITPVKSQRCGDCWANAATEQIESYLAIETNEPAKVLSVEQIASCSSNAYKCGGTGGCEGGIAQVAYQYAELFGLVNDTEYPYDESWNPKECKYNATEMTSKVFVRGYETLPRNDYDSIINHVAKVGPLSASIAVGWSDMKAYGGGVYKDCSYDRNIELNHVVQLVGYGTDEENGDYWLLRNSWGLTFGDQGYFKFAREKEVRCGENNTPLGGTACVGDGQTIQKVCGMCGVLFDTSYPIGTSKTK